MSVPGGGLLCTLTSSPASQESWQRDKEKLNPAEPKSVVEE